MQAWRDFHRSLFKYHGEIQKCKYYGGNFSANTHRDRAVWRENFVFATERRNEFRNIAFEILHLSRAWYICIDPVINFESKFGKSTKVSVRKISSLESDAQLDANNAVCAVANSRCVRHLCISHLHYVVYLEFDFFARQLILIEETIRVYT